MSADIVPLNGSYSDMSTMLRVIASDPDVDRVCLIAFNRDGTATPAQFGCKRSDLAFASVIWANEAVKD